MAQSIWERFGIDISRLENMDDAAINLLGVDNGAGNCCVVQTATVLGERTRNLLFFDESHNVDKLFTAYGCSDIQALVGKDAVKIKESEIYVNFKMPPDNEVSEQCYGRNLDNLTYREIMQGFFQTMMESIFRNNKSLLKRNHTILFVGRPASPRWQLCDLEYQRLLGDGLEERLRQVGYSGTVDIVIYSEAQAALAFEYSEKQIRENEIVLIIDCGSSTFDAVLVQGHRIIAEHSRQLGAGMIEKLMFDLILAQGDENILQSVDAREEMHRDLCTRLEGSTREGEVELSLRDKKERFFGEDGTDQNDQYQKFRLSGLSKPLKGVIDEDFMHQVIYDIPVRVQDSEIAEGGYACFETTDYLNFYDAAKSFMQGAKRKCDAAGIQPDRVVLTGGASVMPFIGELVRQVFGEDSLGGDAVVVNPAFSVGEGLAFMGHIEIQKHRALEELKREIGKLLLSDIRTRQNVAQLIREPYLEALWDSIVKDFETWSTTDRLGTTVRRGIQGEGFSVETTAICQSIQRKFAEEGGLFQTIQGVINRYFAALFPQKSVFSFQIKTNFLSSILHNTQGLARVTIKKSDLLGLLSGLFTSLDEPLPQDKRRSIANRIATRKLQSIQSLRSQLTPSALEAAEQLLKVIQPQVEEELSAFIDEKVTPYFVADFAI